MVVVHGLHRYIAICLNIRTAVSDVKGWDGPEGAFKQKVTVSL